MTMFCRSSTVMMASIDDRMMPIMRASFTLDWLRASLVAADPARRLLAIRNAMALNRHAAATPAISTVVSANPSSARR